MASIVGSVFGRQLKQWRRQRGVSQLELAARANVSQRHISFIETGRSRPKEEMVERISEALDIPLRERNALLEAAGLTALYPELPLSAAALAPFRQAIARLLETHEPFPAFVISRWWDVVDGNRAARRLFPQLDAGPVNFCEVFFSPGPIRKMVSNYAVVVWQVLRRLRSEVASAGPDERLHGLLARAEQLLSDVPQNESTAASSEMVLCPHLLIQGQVIKTLSMVARFGNTRELTLDELRVELMLPQDAEAEAFFRGLAREG
jgi:transcriptional regulator with XRE-family HTH domain